MEHKTETAVAQDRAARTEIFEPKGPISRRVLIGRVLALVIPIGLWFTPLHLDPRAQHALAVTSFIVIAWVTEALDHALTGLIGCYLFWALGVVKFNVAFSGFANATAWFCS